MWMESLNDSKIQKKKKKMKNWIHLVVFAIILTGCKSAVSVPTETPKTEPSFAYKQQMENLENNIYFKGNGNEPDWNLKISKKNIQFTSLISGFESFIGNHVEPISAMDANVKIYQVKTEAVRMNIQIMQQECINTMSGDKSGYSVRVELVKDNKSTFLNGCGNYITDYRLHDIWALEEINGQKISPEDFIKEIPYLEINSTTNQFMGYAGCNRMNGTIFFEKGLLRFTNIMTTRMFCGANNIETKFLKTLQSTTNYKVENMHLTLTNASGENLVFKKVD